MANVEFHVSGLSGIVTGAAADGVLFAFRNPDTNTAAVRLKRITAKWRTIGGYTAAQEVSLGLYQVTAFGTPSADYTGGTSLGDTIRKFGPDTASKPLRLTLLGNANISIAGVGGLAHAGAPTIAAQPFAFDGCSELATGATVGKGGFDVSWSPSFEATDSRQGLVCIPGQGFILRNPIALGAGGTGRLFVECAWEES